MLSQCIQSCAKILPLAFDAEYVGPVDLPVQDSEELSKKGRKRYNRVRSIWDISAKNTLRSSLLLGILLEPARVENC